MKELIPKDKYGVFAGTDNTVRADSMFVAETFGKRHDNVLQAIARITGPDSGYSEDFKLLNFKEVSYRAANGQLQRAYAMTRDGFTAVVMSFTGKKADRFKELYIRAFNQMEASLQSILSLRDQFPKLTERIQALHDDPKPYHYSNEADMLNRIVLGMTAKQYREERGLKKGESIRPYLSPSEIRLMDELQTADSVLLLTEPDFQKRKLALNAYKAQLDSMAKASRNDSGTPIGESLLSAVGRPGCP